MFLNQFIDRSPCRLTVLLALIATIGGMSHAIRAASPVRSIAIQTPIDGTVLRADEIMIHGTIDWVGEQTTNKLSLVVLAMSLDSSSPGRRMRSAAAARPRWTVVGSASIDPRGGIASRIERSSLGLAPGRTNLGKPVTAALAVMAIPGQVPPRGKRYERLPASLIKSGMVRVRVFPPSDRVDQIDAKVVLPVDNQDVASEEIVIVRGVTSPNPVVLIRSALSDTSPAGLWYVQSRRRQIEDDLAGYAVRFGTGDTPDQTAFDVAVAVAPTPADYATLIAAGSFRDLPKSADPKKPIVRGPSIRVTLDRHRRSAADIDRMRINTADAAGVTIGLVQSASTDPDGLIHSSDRHLVVRVGCGRDRVPTLMLRGESDPDHWYVQTTTLASGFAHGGRQRTIKVYLGAPQINKPEKFELVPMSLPAGIAQTLDPDRPPKDLPAEAILGRPMLVRRHQ